MSNFMFNNPYETLFMWSFKFFDLYYSRFLSQNVTYTPPPFLSNKYALQPQNFLTKPKNPSHTTSHTHKYKVSRRSLKIATTVRMAFEGSLFAFMVLSDIWSGVVLPLPFFSLNLT